MTEYKFFDTEPEWTTPGWYATRETAPHLEQDAHRARLLEASKLVHYAYETFGIESVVDLGCGDGGLLSTLTDLPVRAWGYDLQFSNIDVATQRRFVDARYGDFLNAPIDYGDLAICTEVLEHLVDPHGFVRRLSTKVKFVIASSPSTESPAFHYEYHAYAWDKAGYQALLEQNGFTVVKYCDVNPFQVVLGESHEAGISASYG